MTDPFTPLSIRPELSTTTTPSLLHSFPGEHVASIHPLTPRFILLLSPFLFLFPLSSSLLSTCLATSFLSMI